MQEEDLAEVTRDDFS